MAGNDVTVAQTGIYLITAHVFLFCTLATPVDIGVRLFVNGASVQESAALRETSLASDSRTVPLSVIRSLTAADVVSIRSALNGVSATATRSRLSLARMR
jgi:hypothetical protein